MGKNAKRAANMRIHVTRLVTVFCESDERDVTSSCTVSGGVSAKVEESPRRAWTETEKVSSPCPASLTLLASSPPPSTQHPGATD